MSDSGPWIVAEVIDMAGIEGVSQSDIRSAIKLDFRKDLLRLYFAKIAVGERACVEERLCKVRWGIRKMQREEL